MRRPLQLRARGSNLVEFALLLPVLLVLTMGTIDFGYYFLQSARATSVAATAMRTGSLQVPAEHEVAACATCVSTARDLMVSGLADLGIAVSASEVTPSLTAVAGVCSLVLDAELPHRSLVGFVPVPTSTSVQIEKIAQGVPGC